jgi:hypothetical protein
LPELGQEVVESGHLVKKNPLPVHAVGANSSIVIDSCK